MATRKNARKGRSSAGVKAEKRGVKKGGLKLKDLDAKDSKAIRGGARTFEEADGTRAYFGWPAEATAEEGKETIDALGGILADAVTEVFSPERGA